MGADLEPSGGPPVPGEVKFAEGKVVKITEVGGVADGVTLCNGAIDKAIEECVKVGGGIVEFAPRVPTLDDNGLVSVETNPLGIAGGRGIVAGMFLRTHHRRKYGKDHYYFSVVENRRVGRMARRCNAQVLYLGEINTTQEAAWRKTLEVFDEDRARPTSLMLFPESQAVPADASNAVQVKLDQMQLCRPRAYGNCWLGCWLWEQLELDRFWQGAAGRGARGGALGQGAGDAGGQPADRSGQRMAAAPARL